MEQLSGSQDAQGLQFEKAEYQQGPDGPMSCAACRRPLGGQYYTANQAAVCASCYGAMQTQIAGGSRVGRALAAGGLGLVAGLAGAVLWFAIRRITGYEIGLVAIVVGVMVGLAVRKGAGRRGGWFYQTMAVALTYACISAQYMPDIVEGFLAEARSQNSQIVAADADAAASVEAVSEAEGDAAMEEEAAGGEAAETEESGLVGAMVGLGMMLVVVFAFSLTVPFLGGVENLIGLLIIGFALYEAWKLNKAERVEFAGPFQLSQVAPASVPTS